MAGRDVLIVDDDRQVRDVLHQIFLAAGYKCVLAKDGDEGLQVFKAGRPPLVVTDLKMPGIAGIELLRQARAVDGDVAVIVLTDAADCEERHREPEARRARLPHEADQHGRTAHHR